MLLVGTYLAAAFALDRVGVSAQANGTYDAIIVAGCRVMPSGRPSPSLARRVERAVEAFEAGASEQLIFTGGVGRDAPISEAEASARLAERLGVSRDAMLLEDASTTTRENARFAAEMLPAGARVLVVSDAYHVTRCKRIFRRHFEEVDGLGAIGPTGPRIQGALREVIAIAADITGIAR